LRSRIVNNVLIFREKLGGTLSLAGFDGEAKAGWRGLEDGLGAGWKWLGNLRQRLVAIVKELLS